MSAERVSKYVDVFEGLSPKLGPGQKIFSKFEHYQDRSIRISGPGYSYVQETLWLNRDSALIRQVDTDEGTVSVTKLAYVKPNNEPGGPKYQTYQWLDHSWVRSTSDEVYDDIDTDPTTYTVLVNNQVDYLDTEIAITTPEPIN
jgi:hypothetical protein